METASSAFKNSGAHLSAPVIATRLEIERLNLLFRQNLAGVFGLILFGSSYAYICGDMMSPRLLTTWFAVVAVSCVLRLYISWAWSHHRETVKTVQAARPWSMALQSLLFVSGAAWGIAGWMMRYAQTPEQKIFVSLMVVFMVAGAMVCWSVSRYAMFLVVLPAFVPWCLTLMISSDPLSTFMGVLSFIYLLAGSKVGISLHQYVERSLKLNIENTLLNEAMTKEIEIKDQAEESLRLALSSSHAMEWRWDAKSDVFVCKGDLGRSLGLEARYYSGTRAEFQRLLISEDRANFETRLDGLIQKGGDLDLEVRVRWADGKVRTLVFRGTAHTLMAEDGAIVTQAISGIAWDTTAQKIQVRIQQERDIHEAANKAKSMFLANASHEIRTPLAAISGFVEALLQATENQDGIKERVSQMRSDLLAINRNSKHLISLVNDFLDLSKLETGRLYVQRSSMSPQDEIEESILMVRASLDAKKLNMHLEYEDSLPDVIECDSLRFRQIIVNLLSNAIKFSESGWIGIRVGHKGQASGEGILTVRVSDTGIGMDEKTMRHLFEPFMRGTSEEVQRVSGSGLGLTLSRNLARLLGGDLRLVRSRLGEGSEFELTVSTGSVKTVRPAPKPTVETSSHKLKRVSVLVADDDEDLRDLMKRFLERHGATVLTARHGQEAIEKAFIGNYDVILMDMKMPVLDGYGATAKLRELGYRKPIIALTAYANTEDKQRSLDAGCDNYLSKPVNFEFMLETISSYMQPTINPALDSTY